MEVVKQKFVGLVVFFVLYYWIFEESLMNYILLSRNWEFLSKEFKRKFVGLVLCFV